MKRLLPQANSLQKVVDEFIFYGCRKSCSIQDIANYCSFEPRQAQYYLSACIYLGLVNDDGGLSEIGKEIIENEDSATITKNIYIRVITDELISKIFSLMLISPDFSITPYACDLVSSLYPDYGEAVVKRRVSTLVSWCREIIDYVKCQ